MIFCIFIGSRPVFVQFFLLVKEIYHSKTTICRTNFLFKNKVTERGYIGNVFLNPRVHLLSRMFFIYQELFLLLLYVNSTLYFLIKKQEFVQSFLHTPLFYFPFIVYFPHFLTLQQLKHIGVLCTQTCNSFEIVLHENRKLFFFFYFHFSVPKKCNFADSSDRTGARYLESS